MGGLGGGVDGRYSGHLCVLGGGGGGGGGSSEGRHQEGSGDMMRARILLEGFWINSPTSA